jgi:hypothetical protein
VYSQSYYTLTALKQVSDGRDRVDGNLPPRAIGTSASPLMQKLDGRHYGATLTPHEVDMIRYWIESAAPYPGTYAALGTGMIGNYSFNKHDTSDQQWPASRAAAEAIGRRCQGCHDHAEHAAGSMPLPQYLSDDMGLTLNNPDPDDVRIRYARHRMFNLTRPEKSLMLLAPLAAESGGYGLCKAGKPGGPPASPAPVFADTRDADYQAILAMCREGKKQLDQIKRFDMPGFQPAAMYVREMKRFGILPQDLSAGSPIDVYATDQAYWRSLWWQPPAWTHPGVAQFRVKR